jgi:hypothetical protein
MSEITVFDAFNSRKMQKKCRKMQKNAEKMQKNAEKFKKIQSACFVIQSCSNPSRLSLFFMQRNN